MIGSTPNHGKWPHPSEGVLLTLPSYPTLSSLMAKTDRLPHLLPGVVELLGREQVLSPALLDRARSGIDRLRRDRLGGTCWAPEFSPETTLTAPRLALAPAEDADPGVQDAQMINFARNSGYTEIVVLAHGLDAARRQEFEQASHDNGWCFVAHEVDPWSVIDHVDMVVTDGGLLGFLALLAGVTVKCFADCFYSGWGLTDDGSALQQHPTRRSREELFAATLLVIPQYTNPFYRRSCGFEEACDILSEWRRVNSANRSIAACVGMSFWKRRQMRDMLKSTDGVPGFYRFPRLAVRRARLGRGGIAVWASREPRSLPGFARAASVPLIRVEDGFLRSVGLGADFIPAASIITDREGIYYDPSRPSDFSVLASTATFDPALLERASQLRRLLVDRGITKYNTGSVQPAVDFPPDSRRIFVPGQVEDDRSVIAAGGDVRGNLDLLRRIRAANPNAYIVYKPHPDVDAGHRKGAVPDRELTRFADIVVRDVSSADLIGSVDEIHTLTSLAGFEALLRDRRVVVYGQPFYAGWGLTVDLAPAVAGRQRKLSIEQLVAVTLILYPRYLDPVTRLPCGPEVIIERLGQPELWRPGMLVQLRRIHGSIMGVFRRRRAMLHHTRAA